MIRRDSALADSKTYLLCLNVSWKLESLPISANILAKKLALSNRSVKYSPEVGSYNGVEKVDEFRLLIFFTVFQILPY